MYCTVVVTLHQTTKCASSDLLTFASCRYEEERFDLGLRIMKFVLHLAALLCGGVAAQREGCAYLEVRYNKEDT